MNRQQCVVSTSTGVGRRPRSKANNPNLRRGRVHTGLIEVTRQQTAISDGTSSAQPRWEMSPAALRLSRGWEITPPMCDARLGTGFCKGSYQKHDSERSKTIIQPTTAAGHLLADIEAGEAEAQPWHTNGHTPSANQQNFSDKAKCMIRSKPFTCSRSAKAATAEPEGTIPAGRVTAPHVARSDESCQLAFNLADVALPVAKQLGNGVFRH
jgi:hypothetical protein